MNKAFLLGIISSFFFAFTFILNQQMNISSSSWLWSSSLRYIFMLPILFVMLIIKNKLLEVLIEIKKETSKMVYMEHNRIWIILCTFKLCFFIWSIMAYSWYLADNYSCWCSFISIIFSNNRN